MNEDIKELAIRLWKELIYLVVTVFFCISLSGLNGELNNLGLNGFKLLAYKNYTPIWYCLITFVLFGIALYLIFRRARSILNDYLELDEVIINVFVIIVLFSLMVVLFILINNPILRTLLVVTGVVGAIIYSD
ncbi:MAG: hypothetical protein RSB35_07970 [Eubacterium sp.]